jgi:predicted phosphodiesterase
VDASAAALIEAHQPDIVVFGHSHKAAHWQSGSTHFINPGAAGVVVCQGAHSQSARQRLVGLYWLFGVVD